MRLHIGCCRKHKIFPALTRLNIIFLEEFVGLAVFRRVLQQDFLTAQMSLKVVIQQKLLFVPIPRGLGATEQRETFHLPSNLFAAPPLLPGRKQFGRQAKGFPLIGCAAAGGRGVRYK